MHHAHPESGPGQWLGLAAAADALGVHVRTVERRIKAGTMESRRGEDDRVEAWVPGTPDTAPGTPDTAGGGASVVDPDRQLVLGITAMKATERRLGEIRHDLHRTRRAAVAGWAVAGLAIAGMGLAGAWVSSAWMGERASLEADLAELRAAGLASDVLVDRVEGDLAAERDRVGRLEAALDAAGEERADLLAALAEAHRRGDDLRAELAAAASDLAEERARHRARQSPGTGWAGVLARLVAGADARQAPDTAPGVPAP